MKIRNLSFLLIGGVSITVLLYAGTLVYLSWPISEFSISSSGVFGDSFGLLTSLFSGLAFAGLIITIVMQREELALQRQELQLTRDELSGQKQEMKAQNETLMVQKFEHTFFKMLELLEHCRSDITFQQHQRARLKGREAIEDLYKELSTYYLNRWEQEEGLYGNSLKVPRDNIQTKAGLSEYYIEFYQIYDDQLGQYYRCLYNIIKLVERAEFIEEKSVYTNLIRAQLSRYELLLLYYNCVSELGNAKMAPLVKKYNMLKHIELKLLEPETNSVYEYF